MVQRIKLLSIILGMAWCNPLFSQTPPEVVTTKTAKSKLVKQYLLAKDLAYEGNKASALEILDKLVVKEPNFIEALFLKAAIHYDLGAFKTAVTYYEKGLQLDRDFDHFILYQLGLSYSQIEEYQKAISYLNDFISFKNSSSIWVKRAKKNLELFEFRYLQMNSPIPFSPKPLQGAVNTELLFEYLPTLSADGQLLIYTCRNNGQEDLWYSTLSDGRWSKGQPIPNINTDDNEGAQTISPDGKTIVFTACNRPDGAGSCDLYITFFNGQNWTPPSNMGMTINSGAWESQPCLADNGNILFFASTRSGGQGGSDIWYSKKNSAGVWTTPIVLDSTINTPEDDQAPFFHPDNQTLYFMSKGHLGMGGFDLFKSQLAPNGNWSKPQNLGYPINSKSNEGALFVSLNGSIGYYDTDITGQADIYTFEMPASSRPRRATYVKCTVKDAETLQPLGAQVILTNLSNLDSNAPKLKESQSIFFSNPMDGTFLICLPVENDYSLQIELDGYFFYSENFALQTGTIKDSLFEITALLNPIKLADSSIENEIILNNIFFNSGTFQLSHKSAVELQRLILLLQKNSGLKIRINGHTDNVGTEEDNLILSENRAFAVYQYLINNGIDSSRLDYKGYGESRPIVNNDTEENKAINRRTSFQVISNH
jgi:outer membrane protein OmpA-like peptidoglycan-associated protein